MPKGDVGTTDVSYSLNGPEHDEQEEGPGHIDWDIDRAIYKESWWEEDAAEINEVLAAPYGVGHNDRYICIDDAYKVNIGREKYLRIALVEFEKGEDMTAYLQGDRDAFRQKMKEGKFKQIDIVFDSWKPYEDDFIADVTNKAIAEMAHGEAVDIYACNFFKSYIGGQHDDIVFASGHKPNKYRRYVKTADVATKWMDDGEPTLGEFVKDVDRFWQDNPGVRGQETFDLNGRTVHVSDEVRKHYRSLNEEPAHARAA